MNKLNFDEINNKVIQCILNSEENNKVVLVGSFALYEVYKINNSLKNDKLELKIKDLDFDFKNVLKDGNKTWKDIEKIIEEYLTVKFNKIFKSFDEYFNIKKSKLLFNISEIKQRKYNIGNFGITVTLDLETIYGEHKYFHFDVGFETKNLKVLQKEINLENKKYKVNVYTLEKMLADKYLAIWKRLKIITNNKLNNLKFHYENYYKISKDLFDINNISKQNINNFEVNSLIKQMIHLKEINNIDKFVHFINKMILNNIEVTKNRGIEIDLNKEISKYKEVFHNKKNNETYEKIEV